MIPLQNEIFREITECSGLGFCLGLVQWLGSAKPQLEQLLCRSYFREVLFYSCISSPLFPIDRSSALPPIHRAIVRLQRTSENR